jgi:hypothetical protein
MLIYSQAQCAGEALIEFLFVCIFRNILNIPSVMCPFYLLQCIFTFSVYVILGVGCNIHECYEYWICQAALSNHIMPLTTEFDCI